MDDVKPQVGAEGDGQGSSVAEQQTGGQEPQVFDAEYVRRLRAEAASYRVKLRELEETVKRFESEKLTEQERQAQRLAALEREHTELQRRLQEERLQHQVVLHAQRVGIVDPEAAWKLLDMAAVEFDEDGQPRNLEALLRQMVQQRPYLAAQPAVTPTNPARGAARTYRRSELRDPAFFKAHREDILRAMREGRIEED